MIVVEGIFRINARLLHKLQKLQYQNYSHSNPKPVCTRNMPAVADGLEIKNTLTIFRRMHT